MNSFCQKQFNFRKNQYTQDETTLIVWSNNVIVSWVDSNLVTTNAFTGKHEIVLGWLTGMNQFLFSKSVDRGTNFNTPAPVTIFSNAALNFQFLRSRTSPANDFFRGPIMPTIMANPISGDIYAVYHDAPVNGAAPNIYFVQSSDGGTNWSQRIQVHDIL